MNTVAEKDHILQMSVISEDGQTLFDAYGTKYIVPLYQREFAWGTKSGGNRENELRQLIDDVLGMADEGYYYLGSLVVAKREDGVYEVVDGQQRLTAIAIILACLGQKTELNDYLSYDHRESANDAISNLDDLVNGDANDRELDSGIVNGVKIVMQKLTREKIKPMILREKFKRVKLLRVELPPRTDLNHYFELMNTRGVQLEPQDIVKADMMGMLIADPQRRKAFEEIWRACADMDGYVVMHFLDVGRRSKIFGKNWDERPKIDELMDDTLLVRKGVGEKVSDDVPLFDALISGPIELEKAEVAGTGNDTRIRFQSIIKFTNFLQHVLRMFVSERGIVDKDGKSLLNREMDDKRLISEVSTILKEGRCQGASIDGAEFAWAFAICLLECRFLFDKYVIKREFSTGDTVGVWSLKTARRQGDSVEYVGTDFSSGVGSDRQTTPNKMIQACMRVSYMSPKSMHWITDLLKWLHENGSENVKNHLCDCCEFVEEMAREAVRMDFFGVQDYASLGVNTPHIVFNYLDYLLWDDDRSQDFRFEYRDSVEHWFPQHPNQFDAWNPNDGHGTVDRFGNLCILATTDNSLFSNLPPESKKVYGRIAEEGSLKLREMAKSTIGGDGIPPYEMWRTNQCEVHEKSMLEKLRQACENDKCQVTRCH